MIDVRLEVLDRMHNREAFDCGEESVTSYLRRIALQAQGAFRASTMVAVPPGEPTTIMGYLTLIGIRIVDDELPDDLARTFRVRNLRSGAPAVLLAQLGVAGPYAGQGLGAFLLGQAVCQSLIGATAVGGVALIVDAIGDAAAQWYRRQIPDFRPLTSDGLRLLLPMSWIAAAAGNQTPPA